MTFAPDVYAAIRDGCIRSAAKIVPAAMELLYPESVIDVGCGEGWFAREFASRGCLVRAIDREVEDGYRDGVEFVRKTLDPPALDPGGEKFDLAVCLEVAEHLPEASSDALVAALTACAPIVLWSAAIPGQTGHGHINCFPEGTVVSGPRARRSFSRSYQGPLVKLALASGDFFSATPNHPVLTPEGWVPAGLLHEGSHIVRCDNAEGIAGGIPGDYQSPAMIQDVAASVGIYGGVATESVPTSAEDFDGDGIGSKVAIVRTDGELGADTDYSARAEPSGELALLRSFVPTRVLVGDSSTASRLPGIPLTTSRGLSRRHELSVLVGTATSGVQPIYGRSAPRGYTSLSQSSSDSSSADAEGYRQVLRRFSGHVSLDQVVHADTAPFNGDVYNLETKQGWYVADNVIVHNCQWPSYWAARFGEHGFACCDTLRWMLWDDAEVEVWYRQNLLVYADTNVGAHGRYLSFAKPVAVVHPEMWSWKL